MDDNLSLSRRHFVELISSGVLCTLAVGIPREAFAGQGFGSPRDFVDSLGRNVYIPSRVESVTPTGMCAQAMLCMLFPEKLASVAASIDGAENQEYRNAGMSAVTDLPETGTATTSTDAGINATEVVNVSPSIMLDVGVAKEGLESELDVLQEETGVPYAFIDISFGKLPEAYRTLGRLLGCSERSERLATYVENVHSEIEQGKTRRSGSCKVFYAPRVLGLGVSRSVSLQADAITFIGAMPIMTPYDYENRTVDLDALAAESADLILFDDIDCLDSLRSGEGEAFDIWSPVPAIREGRFAVSPALFHSWLGSLVFVQSIGMLWLASIIWPEAYDDDMTQRAKEFYELFYGFEAEDETVRALVGEYDETGYAYG